MTKSKGLLEVREFESITCFTDDKIGYGDHRLPEARFKELENFIHEYTGEYDSDVLDFMKIGYRRNVGSVISVKNYVGLVQMKDGFQIQILPKIEFGTEDADNTQTKKIFLKMIRSLKSFPSKIFSDASLKTDKMNIYEIFINMYLQEVQKLVKHGIKSSYVQREDNLNVYKGKLLVNQHIKANMAHAERFYVAYDEFLPDRAENRLIKATLVELQKLTNSAENSKEIRQALIHFEMVEPSMNYVQDFSRVIIDRNTKDYETLMQWSEVFLMNKSFTSFSGTTVSKALLFPMESVYESYVAQQLKKVMLPENWEVRTQDHRHHLFVEPKKQFALRPDIVIEKNGRIVILDTKWKRLVDNPRTNYGISQADMYQMYAYSKKYATDKCPNPEVWLLYPVTAEMKGHSEISFNSGDGAKVSVFFVDVANVEESLTMLKGKLILSQDLAKNK